MPTDRKVGGAAIARLAGEPHRRYNPLTDEWVLVSAGRTRRPWLGAEEPEPDGAGLPYDRDCYLCPGNVRANGNVNPDYAETGSAGVTAWSTATGVMRKSGSAGDPRERGEAAIGRT